MFFDSSSKRSKRSPDAGHRPESGGFDMFPLPDFVSFHPGYISFPCLASCSLLPERIIAWKSASVVPGVADAVEQRFEVALRHDLAVAW